MFVSLIKNMHGHASYRWLPAKLCSATLNASNLDSKPLSSLYFHVMAIRSWHLHVQYWQEVPGNCNSPWTLSVKVKTLCMAPNQPYLLKDLYHLFEQCMCRLEVVIHPQCDRGDEWLCFASWSRGTGFNTHPPLFLTCGLCVKHKERVIVGTAMCKGVTRV